MILLSRYLRTTDCCECFHPRTRWPYNEYLYKKYLYVFFIYLLFVYFSTKHELKVSSTFYVQIWDHCCLDNNIWSGMWIVPPLWLGVQDVLFELSGTKYISYLFGLRHPMGNMCSIFSSFTANKQFVYHFLDEPLFL